jgi:tRNA pseudouridine13 synthase
MSLSDHLAAILNPPRRYPSILPAVTFNQTCEDFEVEEIPAYLPDGQGEHLYLWIEKRDLPAAELLSRLARSLNVSSRDIGVAGQKDRRAVTRQFVSVPRTAEPLLGNIDDDRIRILSVSAHGNKLRTGHLNGNRFQIVLRAESGEAFDAAQADAVAERLQLLVTDGFPNYFGPQRFGHEGSTAIDGIAFVKGEISAKQWKFQQRHFMTKMVASAAQSAVLNLSLAARLTAGTCASPLSGDVVCRREGVRPFLFDDRGETPADQLIPMGPMPGEKMVKATGDILLAEAEVLLQLGLTAEDFLRHRKVTSGTRRSYLAYPSSTAAALTSDCAIRVTFDLSAGSFATVLLAEIAAS